MNSAIRKWIEALRSGEYNQTSGTLHDKNGFCCLGVYALVNGLASKDQMFVDIDEADDKGPDWVYSDIREDIQDELVDTAIFMNDDGNSFSVIASMIRGYYK